MIEREEAKLGPVIGTIFIFVGAVAVVALIGWQAVAGFVIGVITAFGAAALVIATDEGV